MRSLSFVTKDSSTCHSEERSSPQASVATRNPFFQPLENEVLASRIFSGIRVVGK